MLLWHCGDAGDGDKEESEGVVDVKEEYEVVDDSDDARDKQGGKHEARDLRLDESSNEARLEGGNKGEIIEALLDEDDEKGPSGVVEALLDDVVVGSGDEEDLLEDGRGGCSSCSSVSAPIEGTGEMDEGDETSEGGKSSL